MGIVHNSYNDALLRRRQSWDGVVVRHDVGKYSGRYSRIHNSWRESDTGLWGWEDQILDSRPTGEPVYVLSRPNIHGWDMSMDHDSLWTPIHLIMATIHAILCGGLWALLPILSGNTEGALFITCMLIAALMVAPTAFTLKMVSISNPVRGREMFLALMVAAGLFSHEANKSADRMAGYR